MNRTPFSRFAALEYRARGLGGITPIILLVLDDSKGGLHFLVHPGWRDIVQAEDIDYLDALFQDFPVRSRLHPEALFDQISSIGVGPIVTRMVGEEISGHPALVEMRFYFVQL